MDESVEQDEDWPEDPIARGTATMALIVSTAAFVISLILLLGHCS